MNEVKSPIISVENLDGSLVPEETLTFPEAMEDVIHGKVITRLEWNDREIFCLLKSGILTIHNETGFHSWIINDGDMSAEDWIILT